MPKDPVREALSTLRHQQPFLHGSAPTSVGLGLNSKENAHSKMHAGLNQVMAMVSAGDNKGGNKAQLITRAPKLNKLNPKTGDEDGERG